jgi:hypothetical protein
MILIDRSRVLSFQACPRRRYLEYHHLGTGIQRKAKSLPLVFGSAFHEGSEQMLKGDIEGAVLRSQLFLSNVFEERGVSFDREEPRDVNVAWQFGMEEQGAMAEALLRGFWAYEGEALLRDFEILEVEREGRALLKEGVKYTLIHSEPATETQKAMEIEAVDYYQQTGSGPELVLMFRPDALIRERSTGDLYVISWKTCSTFGVKTTREAMVDMQSCSEVWGREQGDAVEAANAEQWGKRMKIEGVLYKFVCKGQRRKDNWDGLYKQSTHLIYGWRKLGRAADETDWSWSYEFPNEEDPNKMSRLGKGWQKVPIWREYPGGVKAWIGALAANEIFPRHTSALEAAFPGALPISRRPDEIERWKRQIIQQELTVAAKVEAVHIAMQTGDQLCIDSTLDANFPQHTRSCEEYSGCSMHDVCWVPTIGADPIGSGLYQIRTSTNHPEHGGDNE